MPREKAIVKRIVDWLNAQPNCLARKRHGTAYAVAGDPDIVCCWRGQHIEIECKQPGEAPSAIQHVRLEEWRKSGAICIVAHGLEQVKEVLEFEGFWKKG